MGNIIIIIAATFVFTIWPVKLVATWLGAEKNSYGAVILALILAFLLGILAAIVSIPLAFLGLPGLVLMAILFLFVIGKAYSRALVTPFWNGVAIAIVAGIVGALLQVLFALVFGVSLFPKSYEGEVSVVAVEDAAEDVCRCGTDETCMQEKVDVLGQITEAAEAMNFPEKDSLAIQNAASRAFSCVLQPGPYKAPKKKKSKKTRQPIQTSESQDAPQRPGAQRPGDSGITDSVQAPKAEVVKKSYAWRQATILELPDLLNRSVKVVTSTGGNRNGKLESFANGELIIRKSKGIAYTVPVSMVGTIEVYDEAR